VCYDILFKNPKKYLLKSTQLDLDYKNPTEDIVVMVYDDLFNCIAGIIGRLRNTELQLNLYKKLQPVNELPDVYHPLVKEFEESVLSKDIKSFSIFGNLKKYKPQSKAKELLKHMGYFILTTKRPHVYVLEEFIREEYKQLSERRPSDNSIHRT
jgi:hypothetical protein